MHGIDVEFVEDMGFSATLRVRHIHLFVHGFITTWWSLMLDPGYLPSRDRSHP